MTTNNHTWLTISEAAQELRVSVPTIRRWIRAGRLVASRIGVRSLRIQRSELAALIETNPSTLGATPDVKIVGGDERLSFNEVLALLRTHREAMLARRGGIPLPDSSEAIREMREMRFEDL